MCATCSGGGTHRCVFGRRPERRCHPGLGFTACRGSWYVAWPGERMAMFSVARRRKSAFLVYTRAPLRPFPCALHEGAGREIRVAAPRTMECIRLIKRGSGHLSAQRRVRWWSPKPNLERAPARIATNDAINLLVDGVVVVPTLGNSLNKRSYFSFFSSGKILASSWTIPSISLPVISPFLKARFAFTAPLL
jgi:hypothetical protein